MTNFKWGNSVMGWSCLPSHKNFRKFVHWLLSTPMISQYLAMLPNPLCTAKFQHDFISNLRWRWEALMKIHNIQSGLEIQVKKKKKVPKIFANNITNDLGFSPEFNRVLNYSLECYQSLIRTPGILLHNFWILKCFLLLSRIKGKDTLKA